MEPLNSLYKCLPPEMVHPWKTNLSEIRLTNVKSKNLEEHLEYMKRYTGQDKRFVDVKVTFSHVVRLTYSSRCVYIILAAQDFLVILFCII